jgi:hypothetical protein
MSRLPKSRNLYLPGFVIGFILFALASCGGAALMLGVDASALVNLGNAGPAWTPPPLPTQTPTPTVAEAAAAPAPALIATFRAGQSVRNITNSKVNVRREPGYLGKPGDDVIRQIEPGDTVTILEGPTASDGLIWWHIDVNGAAGWVAEATASGVQILGSGD